MNKVGILALIALILLAGGFALIANFALHVEPHTGPKEVTIPDSNFPK